MCSEDAVVRDVRLDDEERLRADDRRLASWSRNASVTPFAEKHFFADLQGAARPCISGPALSCRWRQGENLIAAARPREAVNHGVGISGSCRERDVFCR